MVRINILIKLWFFVLISFLAISAQSQSKFQNTEIQFNKTDIEAIFSNDNKKIYIEYSIIGFESKNEAKTKIKESTFSKTTIKEFSKEKTVIKGQFIRNIHDFRTLLEQNGIETIIVNGLKIKTSNLITQEKALEISQSIIDVPAMQFQASYNNPDNIGHYDFNVYYFESKLFNEMHNYYASLLNGFIDKLQDSVLKAKKEREEYVQNNTK